MENKNLLENELENVTGGASGINNQYTMKPGDTLYSVAAKYHTTVSMLMYLNPNIKNADWVPVGTVIRIR